MEEKRRPTRIPNKRNKTRKEKTLFLYCQKNNKFKNKTKQSSSFSNQVNISWERSISHHPVCLPAWNTLSLILIFQFSLLSSQQGETSQNVSPAFSDFTVVLHFGKFIESFCNQAFKDVVFRTKSMGNQLDQKKVVLLSKLMPSHFFPKWTRN